LLFYVASCDLPLFSSDAKFEGRAGWPSFFKPSPDVIETEIDRSSLLTTLTEVHCRRCLGHLGHVFADCPTPIGLRYCMNGVALKFALAADTMGNS
jgi:peptide-methionine (R)-S-oxide reductase